MYDRNTEKEELWLHFKWDIKKADRATNEAHRVTPNKLLDAPSESLFSHLKIGSQGELIQMTNLSASFSMQASDLSHYPGPKARQGCKTQGTWVPKSLHGRKANQEPPVPTVE